MTSILYSRSCDIFFFNDTATTEIYTLSLHDALPILRPRAGALPRLPGEGGGAGHGGDRPGVPHHQQLVGVHGRRARAGDRKSTRLNSSHANISYAVFCLKKKKQSIMSVQRSFDHVTY